MTLTIPRHFKFKLTTRGGAVYFCDSQDNVLRVIDNNRANANGRVIESIEYAPMITRRRWFRGGEVHVCGTFRMVNAEELRRHHIADIYDVDARRDDSRALVLIVCILGFAAVFVAGAWLFGR